MNEIFRKFATKTETLVGTSWAFGLATLIILAWIVSGPYFHYSDTWQLVINTGTTIITFLMVFLIQNAQNRSDKATQLKLDEIIKGLSRASNKLIQAEDLSDEELEKLKDHIFNIIEKKRKKHKSQRK
jgi:low affinity Fe/Cu permease